MVRIITDSTSSLPKDVCEDLNIEVISLIINRNSVEYVESETDLDAFYKDIYEMADAIPTSSQPSPKKVRDVLEKHALAHEEVLGIFISSKMSGTFEGFIHGAQETRKNHPEFTYAAIDSTTNCMEMGFAVIAAAKAAKEGESLEQCIEAAEESLHCSRFIFAPESLTFLEKGGRIGKAAALIGHLINISPILTVKDGEAGTLTKARTQKKALEKMVKVLEKDIAQYGLKNLVVHYIGSRVPAEEWADKIINPITNMKAKVLPASPVIGVHVGPALGIAYECKHRLPNKFTTTSPERVLS